MFRKENSKVRLRRAHVRFATWVRHGAVSLLYLIYPLEHLADSTNGSKLRVIHELPFENTDDFHEGRFSLDFSGIYGFIQTPFDLYRLVLPIGPDTIVEKLNESFQFRGFRAFHIHNKVLFITINDTHNPLVYLRSEDYGDTFLDARNQFLMQRHPDGSLEAQTEALLTTQFQTVGNLLYSNAGGGLNLLVSEDNAESWRVVYGEWGNMVASMGTRLVTGNIALIGGEAPLDVAWIGHLELSPDGMFVEQDFGFSAVYPSGPGLGNRNVMVFGENPATGTILAGVEGGILRSIDKGQCFTFTLRYSSNPEERIGDITDNANNRYPYFFIPFSFSRKYYHRVYAATPERSFITNELWGSHNIFVGVSHDDGKTWESHTRTALELGNEIGFVIEDPNERLLMAVANWKNSTLYIAEWNLPDPIADHGPGDHYLGDGWWQNDIVGTFNGGHHPWLWWKKSEQWIWWTRDEADGSWWFWHPQRGWLWSRADIFGWVYQMQAEQFIYNPFAGEMK